MFLIEDENGEKFGYYLNTKVVEKYWPDRIETDNKSFEFNLQSNGRLEHPMKFEIIDLKEGGYQLWKKSNDWLIILGNILLVKENKKNQSFYFPNKNRFDYHGIEKALCGKDIDSYEQFIFKRLLVIQMI